VAKKFHFAILRIEVTTRGPSGIAELLVLFITGLLTEEAMFPLHRLSIRCQYMHLVPEKPKQEKCRAK